MILRKLITNEKDILKLVANSVEQKSGSLVTYFNQHCFNKYYSDSDYKRVIDEQFEVYADGIGIRIALRLFRLKIFTKFNASDLNEKLFQLFISKNLRIYLVGGNFSPSLTAFYNDKMNICGYSNGFYESSIEINLIQNIKNCDPDVIIVGMGVPRQELFSAKLSVQLEEKIIICVGNFLEFYFGTIKRIPKGFRNLGIEWIFRMAIEPRRLWKRYIIGIPIFFFLIIKEYFSIKNR
jgi:N-acetylglucosaminyldiphosphoundecaprenol N-acetyl-beta-D-mannosaminyltransferase